METSGTHWGKWSRKQKLHNLTSYRRMPENSSGGTDVTFFRLVRSLRKNFPEDVEDLELDEPPEPKPNPQEEQGPYITRSGRAVRPPARLQDYEY